MSFIKVCQRDDIPSGGMHCVMVEGKKPITIYRVGDEFFATADNCTHGVASLSEGYLNGDVIECPFHGGSFNFRTGEPVDAPCTIPLECFKVEVKNDDVFVNYG
ncbi:MAG: non-heme iron oxygenase ferredoxin subunit [Rugosibacter sp.]|jgi:carbazole 1,9a-dioxygenase ferredoxin component|nr:non-heme iron oxygenase ferredoxin subunit [Rugosibacter sp.]MDO9272456.1 non-heme iron oxygenase ferredoxin subunit [Rugosibacter sp.]